MPHPFSNSKNVKSMSLLQGSGKRLISKQIYEAGMGMTGPFQFGAINLPPAAIKEQFGVRDLGLRTPPIDQTARKPDFRVNPPFN
jgi:hypothetical protein